MTEWIEKIKDNNIFKQAYPADIHVIQEAEKKLAVKFSADYVAFLQNVGASICFGHEISGLTDSHTLNVIKLTQEQKLRNPNVPSAWYAIEETHMDGIIIWQDQNSFIYQSSPSFTPQKIADSLEQWINM